MDREEGSPTPPEDPTPHPEDEAAAEQGHSGSRWEPRSDADAAPVTGTRWWHHDEAAAAPRARRRGLRVAVGVGAALVLAGGGFAAGHAVGDSGPDGGPGPSVGHHRDHDGGRDRFGAPGPAGPGPAGQGQVGQNPSAGSSPILGGSFT
jgi:hypothetical protein